MTNFISKIIDRFIKKGPAHLRKLKVREIEHVYCCSQTADKRFNTNIKAHLGHLDEMNWGFACEGSFTLALNIFYTFTGDKQFARKYALTFRQEVLEVISTDKSWWIPSSMILNWIYGKTKGAN